MSVWASLILLSLDEIFVYEVCELLAIDLADWNFRAVVQQYSVIRHLDDVIEVDDIRAMHAHKLFRRQSLLEQVEAQQRLFECTTADKNLHIFALPFGVDYIRKRNLNHTLV